MGNNLSQLIFGKAIAYVNFLWMTSPWDTCAVEALITACGGIVTDNVGNIYKYDE